MAFFSEVDLYFQQCDLERVLLMPDKLLAPFSRQVDTEGGTNEDQACDRCLRHRQYCIWPAEGARQKSCDHCSLRKVVCTVSGGVQVCNRKIKGSAGKGKRGLKRAWVEESEAETEGSGDDGWRARGLQSIAFSLLGLKESENEQNELLREQNELRREQNGFLHRIAERLESGLGPEEVPDLTLRE